MIPDQLKWTLFRRRQLAKLHEGFQAHPATYASADSKFDKYVSLHRDTRIYSSEIGQATYIAGATVSAAKINKYCSIGQGARIGLAKHPVDHLSSHPAFYSNGNQTSLRISNNTTGFIESTQLNIGNDVWIGASSLIMGGITIGDGAIIGAGAVVTKDVPPYAIVGGNPAKLIRYRFPPEIIATLLNIQWWNKSKEDIAKINRAVNQGGKANISALLEINNIK